MATSILKCPASGLLLRSFSSAPILAVRTPLKQFIPTQFKFTRPFSSTMADKLSIAEAVKHRRTIYQLTPKSPVPDARVKEILNDIIVHTPSSFNSQSTRMVVLLKEEHGKFWDVVRDVLKAIVPADQWEHTAQRIGGFHNAYGTILFYEDPAPTKALQEKLPIYADKFPEWAEATNAMHQYHAWTVLEAEGFGANLQHYNPLPDQKAAAIWNIPLEWSLKAQLVFGAPAEGARESLPKKDIQPVEKRLFVHGA